jgi:hypothetical protein
MNFDKRYVLLVGVLFLSVNFLTAIPSMAFSSDSFSQKPGDIATWQVILREPGFNFANLEVNDTLRIIIIEATAALHDGLLYDTLQLVVCNGSTAIPTWTVMYDTLTEYNGTHYILPGFGYAVIPFVIPHNQTAVVEALKEGATFNYTWTPGPNGYDGVFAEWEGSILGDLDAVRADFKFSSEGFLEYLEIYNGTGPGWDLGFKMILIDAGSYEIPGFAVNLAILAVGFALATYIFVLRRKIIS